MARDFKGVVVGFMHKKWNFVFDSKMAKLLCVKEALGWIKQYSLGNLIVESDSFVAISDLNNFIKDISYVGSILADCKFS